MSTYKDRSIGGDKGRAKATRINTKQTAVEWLFAHLLPFLDKPDEFKKHYLKCLSESKAMEKEQIMMAVKDSWYMAKGSNFQEPQEEQYYKQTYGE